MNNFHLGFGLAAIGMFIGLVVFMVTRSKNLGLAGTIVVNPLSPPRRKRSSQFWVWVSLFWLP